MQDGAVFDDDAARVHVAGESAGTRDVDTLACPGVQGTAMSAFVALVRLMKKDSSGSYSESPLTNTLTVLLVSPAAKVASPDMAM